jgi:hypothetical protein
VGIATSIGVTVASALALAVGSPADQPIPSWLPEGGAQVFAFGDTLYVGGTTRLAPPNGGGAVLDTSGRRLDASAVLVPPVTAAAGDGRGGFYVADGTGIVHVSTDGSRDGVFASSLRHVDALAVTRGRVLAGGRFGGRAAALDARTGRTLAWRPRLTHSVWTIAVWRRTVYLGGGAGLTAVDALTAARRPCRCSFAAPKWHLRDSPSINSLLVAGRTLYVGGYFGSVGGKRRDSLAAFDAGTGRATGWRPRRFGNTGEGAPEVFALAIDSRRLYLGGDNLHGLDSGVGLVAFDRRGRQLWQRRGPDAYSLVRVGGRVLGLLGHLGEPAAFDPRTGKQTAWDPGAGSGLTVLARSGAHALVGGTVGGFGGVRRGGAGALDSTGTPTAWDPRTDGVVRRFAGAGTTLYLAGGFTNVVGRPRPGLAAVDASTAEVLPWVPKARPIITTLAVAGDKVFTGNGGTCEATPRLYGFDRASGAVTTWPLGPVAGGRCVRVAALAGSGSTLYVAGEFGSIAGVRRDGLAAIDARSGAVLPWNPNLACAALELCWTAIAAAGDTVFRGRSGPEYSPRVENGAVLAVGAADAKVRWQIPLSVPRVLIDDLNGYVLEPAVAALAPAGSTLYVGGTFTSLGGVQRMHTAALDAATGTVLPWHPRFTDVEQVVGSIAVGATNLTIGGGFQLAQPAWQPGLARFPLR